MSRYVTHPCTPDHSVKSILSHIDRVIEQTVPLKTASKQGYPWWSTHLDKLKAVARTATREYRHTPTEDNKKLRNRAQNTWKKEVRYARKDFLTQEINKKDSKAIWKTLKNKSNPNNIPDIQGESTFGGKVRLLNEAFFPHNGRPPTPFSPDKLLPPVKDISNHYKAVTVEEVTTALKRDTTTAPGIDGIVWPAILRIQQASPGLLPTLYSQLLWHGIHPQQWKTAKCVPIPKPRKMDIQDPSSYRPISLLPCLSKLLEAVVAARLDKYGTECGGLSKYQMGARPGRSSMDSLMTIMTPAQKWLRVKKDAGREPVRPAILTNDIKGAFNTVSHPILAQIMAHKKFPSYICKWINNFNSNRHVHFSFDGETSELLPFDSGVPQGSLLSPVLYMIFADPLLSATQSINERNTVYMDDDAMLQGGTTHNIISRRLKERLKVKEAIASPLGIKFAPEKADLIYLLPTTSNSPSPTATVPLYQEPIIPKKVIKILGVHIDQKCTFREQSSKAASKAITITAMIRNFIKNQHIVSATVFKLVQALLIPTMLWGSELWWTGADHILRRLGPAYHRAARLITGLPNHTPIEAVLSEAGLPTLEILLNSKSVSYGVRVLLNPDNNEIKSDLTRLLKTPTKDTGFGLERIAHLLKKATNGMPIESATNITLPWLPLTAIHIANTDKETESIAHQQWVSNYPEIYRVYTDGSKEDSVSSAWVSITNNTVQNKGSLNIGQHKDILDGELEAIAAALHHLQQIALTNTPIWLCVDNQLAIKRLAGGKRRQSSRFNNAYSTFKLFNTKGARSTSGGPPPTSE